MNYLKDIIIGIIGGLITFCITTLLTKIWTIQLPLWLSFVLLVGILIFCYTTRYIILIYRVKRMISEFTEGALGDSFIYTWKYKKSSNGRYSAYGYEPTDIHIKRSLSDVNSVGVYTCGHEVPEDKIRLFIQLTIIININKEMKEKLLPLLEYLHWTENQQQHNLYH